MNEIDLGPTQPSTTQKLVDLCVKAPALPIGLAALVSIVGHGLYNLRTRKERLSLYLIRYRVMAQGAFIGCLGVGVGITVIRRIFYQRPKSD